MKNKTWQTFTKDKAIKLQKLEKNREPYFFRFFTTKKKVTRIFVQLLKYMYLSYILRIKNVLLVIAETSAWLHI